MGHSAVKRKVRFSERLSGHGTSRLGLGFLLAALLTFIFSLLPIRSAYVERWFSRTVFPAISFVFGRVADSIPVAWLDILLIAAILYIWICLRRRQRFAIAVAVAIGYLIFFWSWGLNYHRLPLTSKLTLQPADMDSFTATTARELNSLYPVTVQAPYDEADIRNMAAQRTALVVEKLDGTRWLAARRVKVSWLANPWFRFAGIDGLFNPIAHEPLINNGVLDIERPFVISHELAHVRGYPDEGDANFVALMATLMSDNPRFRYSAWLELWLYVRNREKDSLLDPGPREDVNRIFARLRNEQIRWISNLQSTILDWFLRANSVPEGVRSYARIVTLAAETQSTWDRFR
jgi:Protein of unknown function (DUF3810)